MPFGSSDRAREDFEHIRDLQIRLDHKSNLAEYWEMRFHEKNKELKEAERKLECQK